jgi:hypothetical protein
MYNKIISLIIAIVSSVTLYSQQVTVNLQNSANGCRLTTNCSLGFVCFDIVMTVDQAKNLDSYNIWVTYDNTVISRINGGADSTCVVMDGGDTDIENFASAFRVGGLPLAPYAMPANTPVKVHTICFKILNFGTVGYSAYNGTIISVGGDKFGGALKTVVAFSDGTLDDTVPESFLTVGLTTAPCLCNAISAGADQTGICAGSMASLTGTVPTSGTWAAHSGNPAGGSLGATTAGLASVSFNNSAIGIYRYIYTASACSDTMSLTVVPRPTATAVQATAVSCFGGSNGSATVMPSGGTAGYTIAPSQTGLTVGLKTFTVTDANMCTTTVNVTITQPTSALSATGAVVSLATCGSANGSANITPSGGTGPYMIAPSQTGLTTGIKTFTVTDVRMCTTTVNVTVTEPASLLVSNTEDSGPGSLRQAVGCAQNGEEVTFDSSMQNMELEITSGAILVNKSITISQSAVNPNILTNGYPVFDVTATGVIFRNLHIVVACKANEEALTIKNQGSLTLDNVTLSSNNIGACSHNMVKLIGQLTIAGTGQTKIINP